MVAPLCFALVSSFFHEHVFAQIDFGSAENEPPHVRSSHIFVSNSIDPLGRPVHVCSFPELFPCFSRTLPLSIRPQDFHSFSRCPLFALAPPHLCGLVCPFVAILWRARPFLTRAPAAQAVAAFSHFLLALFFMRLRVCGFVHTCSSCVSFSRIFSHSCLFILMALFGLEYIVVGGV